MGKYEDREATQQAFNKFWDFDYEDEELPGKEYIQELAGLDSTDIFVNELKIRIRESGFKGNTEDTDELVKYLFDGCRKEGIDLSRQTIGNWLTKTSPSSSDNGRENVYKICFALGMNAQQTGEFFLKGYLERPFNYKNISETVYYFCLNNGLPYKEAERIISIVKSTGNGQLKKSEEDLRQGFTPTVMIGENIGKIKKEEELIKYITENREIFLHRNETGMKKVKEMLGRCYTLAQEEYKITNSHLIKTDDNKKANDEKKTDDQTKDDDKTKIDKLLSIIYGYSARATKLVENEDGKTVNEPIYKTSITKSGLPKLVSQNFPQRQQFENIIKGKASYDVIRKALIMLEFYQYFATALVQKEDSGSGYYKDDSGYGSFDEFTDELNDLLNDCGYGQLYWKNPYDWMIGYCAGAVDPLGELRNIIEEFYVSEVVKDC